MIPFFVKFFAKFVAINAGTHGVGSHEACANIADFEVICQFVFNIFQGGEFEEGFHRMWGLCYFLANASDEKAIDA